MSFHAKPEKITAMMSASSKAKTNAAQDISPSPDMSKEARPPESARSMAGLTMARIVWELLGRRRAALYLLEGEAPGRPGTVQKLFFFRARGGMAAPYLAKRPARAEAVKTRNAGHDQESGHDQKESDHSAFMACPLTRAGSAARRIVHMGDLMPHGGSADFLACAITWAEHNPETPLEILWLGEGDLRGVLQAQPMPSNMTQMFGPIPGSTELAAILARCGLLVAPCLAEPRCSWVAEAMAAGLPVLGSVHHAQARALVTHHENGWLFNPLRADEMLGALDLALSIPLARLEEMRGAARARINAPRVEAAGANAARPPRMAAAHGASTWS